MFQLTRKIFIIYFLCITLTGLVMVFIDNKFSEKQIIDGNKSQIVTHTINPNLIMFTSSVGGFLGVYIGIWLFDYEKENFYLMWGTLLILVYNVLLVATLKFGSPKK